VESNYTSLLLVFTRNATLGKVKTRLAATIGDAEALNVHKALMQQTIDQTIHCKCDTVVYYSDTIDENDLFSKNGFRQEVQSGKELGARMQGAITAEFSHGYTSIVIIGTDCPDLDEASISLAFKQLEVSDVVVGPALDGGYYLLGLSAMHSELFEGIEWSTSSVLSDTVQIAEGLSLSMAFTPEKQDIDTFEDLTSSDFGKVHFPYLLNQ
jgi:rSAM/selenodomain-associated transferase 1